MADNHNFLTQRLAMKCIHGKRGAEVKREVRANPVYVGNCSFGDWAALSDTVDEETALFLKREVSDGIIAPDYTEAALAILRQKKGGAYIVLRADTDFQPPPIEYREVYGLCFAQHRNQVTFDRQSFNNIVTADRSPIPDTAVVDLLVASITAKYTQSNSVVYAKDGQNDRSGSRSAEPRGLCEAGWQ